MFRSIKSAHAMSKMAAKFSASTGVDPGDNGQVSRKAMEYVSNLGLEPSDAWLIALVNWMDGMPWPDSKILLARGILSFLDEYEGKVPLSAATILSARQAASNVL